MTKLFFNFLFVLSGLLVFVSAVPAQTVPTCSAAQLAISVKAKAEEADYHDVGGKRGDIFTVKNISKTTCAVQGAPGIKMVDAAGRMMGSEVKPEAGESRTLIAGGTAKFETGYRSCTWLKTAASASPKGGKWTTAALIRFHGIDHVFRVRESTDLDPEFGIEDVRPLYTDPSEIK